MSIRWLFLSILMVGSVSAKADSDIRRDPFLQPDLSAIKATNPQPPTIPNRLKLILKGTLRSGAEVLANINGKTMAIGDEVDGFTLLSVTEQSATLESNAETLTLTLSLENNTNDGREQ